MTVDHTEERSLRWRSGTRFRLPAYPWSTVGFQSRLLPLLAFVVRNDGEEDRPAGTAGGFAICAAKELDQIPVH